MYRAVVLCALVLLASVQGNVYALESVSAQGGAGAAVAAGGGAAGSAAAGKLAAVAQAPAGPQIGLSAASSTPNGAAISSGRPGLSKGQAVAAAATKPAAAAAMVPKPGPQQPQPTSAAATAPQIQQQAPKKAQDAPSAVHLNANAVGPLAPKPSVTPPAKTQPDVQHPAPAPAPAPTPAPFPAAAAVPAPVAAATPAPALVAENMEQQPIQAEQQAMEQQPMQAEQTETAVLESLPQALLGTGPSGYPQPTYHSQYISSNYKTPNYGPGSSTTSGPGFEPGSVRSGVVYQQPYPPGFNPKDYVAVHPHYPPNTHPWGTHPGYSNSPPPSSDYILYSPLPNYPSLPDNPPPSDYSSSEGGKDYTKGSNKDDDNDDDYYDPHKTDSKKAHHVHHTGKAAKKLYSKGGSSYLADDDDSSTDKDYEKLARLQKYYRPEEEQDQDDEGVSTFARPSRYSSKAAKYAALALKAEQKAEQKAQKAAGQPALTVNGKPVASTQQNKPSLTGLAAALMKGVGGNKANTLATPKPNLKGHSNGAAPRDQPVPIQAEYYPEEGEYYATPDGFDSYDGYDGYGEHGKNKTMMMVINEQYHKGGDKHKAKHGVKPQVMHTTVHLDGKVEGYPGHPGYPGYDSYEGYDGYDGYDGGYDSEEDEGKPKKHKRGERKDPPFDIEQNYIPPLRRREQLNTLNFRAVPGSEFTNVGYTMGPGMALLTGTGGRPVVIYYEACLTCGPHPGPAGGIGKCFGSGTMLNPGARTAHMAFTCTIDADASNMCGLKYVQGMTITAQGMVNVDLDAHEARIRSLSADVIPISGVYTPGRRNTLLSDVLTLISGVKGGSLMMRSDGDRNGVLSFYLWR